MNNYYIPAEEARTHAEVFPPGEILKEELVARDWSQHKC